MSVALVAGTLALGAVAMRTAFDRRDAARVVASESTPRVVEAVELYVALADADAAASTTYLRAGLEPADLRDRYLARLGEAGTLVADLGSRSDLSPQADASVAAISQQLSRYAGLVESARANGRQGFPVGAAYLREASDLMRGEILPAATSIYGEASRDLSSTYRSGTSRSGAAALVVIWAVVLGLFAIAQLLVAWRTRRVLNAGLLMASAATVGIMVWAGIAFTSHQSSLVRSQRDGSDQLITLSTMRILALSTLADENLDLIERGTVASYIDDFDRIAGAFGSIDGTGALHDAAALADRTGNRQAIEAISVRWLAYLQAHDHVRLQAQAGRYEGDDGAISTAVNDGASASVELDKTFASEIERVGAVIDQHAAAARRPVRHMPVGLGLLALAAAVLAVAGIEPRIREYR